MNFKKGDKVELNSGGPVMTVKEIDGENVVCEWFNASRDTVFVHTFSVPMLTKLNKKEINYGMM